MLATQDFCDIEVPADALRTRAERLVEMGRGISLLQLMFARECAEFAATDEHEEWGSVTPIDWIRLPLPHDRPAGCQLCGGRRALR